MAGTENKVEIEDEWGELDRDGIRWQPGPESHDNMLGGETEESVNCLKKGNEMVRFGFWKYHFDCHVKNRINLGETGDGETT